jgi:tryptophan synthase alpha chain
VSGGRIARRFDALADAGRAGLITFVTAGDPDHAASAAILAGLPRAGADIIELGMPFSDPMADGPAIQAAGKRALAGGQTLRKTLAMVEAFRAGDDETPILLMGYYNPIHRYHGDAFIAEALRVGVDGLIVVDLPHEENDVLCHPAEAAGLSFIRLVTPATPESRVQDLVAAATGFIYYVTVAGVTGTKSAAGGDIAAGVARIRAASGLPVAAGFGIRTPAQAAETARIVDAVVVGSAVVQRVTAALEDGGDAVGSVLDFVGELAAGVRGARQ